MNIIYADTNKKDILINSVARSREDVKKFGGTLISSQEEINRKLISFWVINRQRDSIELLKKYMDVKNSSCSIIPKQKSKLKNAGQLSTFLTL